jgi:hypothetical protein
MLADIRNETEKALKSLEKAKLTLQQKNLLKELTKDIEKQMRAGDWNVAVRLSYYRHEFSKIFKFLGWYTPYLEIRKTRDQIDIIINDR